MNCSSLPDNQTADFIERFFPFTYNQILENDSGCYDFVNHEYVIWHRSLAEALPLSVQQYGYDSIPNLYTILDTSSLDSAGISRTAEQPFLGNKGRGTLIGIVDTGIDYTNPLSRASPPSGIRRFRARGLARRIRSMRCTTEVSTSVPTSTRRCDRKIRIPSSPPRILSATARRWRWSPPVPKMPMLFSPGRRRNRNWSLYA